MINQNWTDEKNWYHILIEFFRLKIILSKSRKYDTYPGTKSERKY